MRAVLQRVSRAKVSVGQETTGEIKKGIMILLGVARGDTENDADYILTKTINLRIFEDDAGKMNMSLLDVGGGLLVISQFTLHGDVRKGRRPSFMNAADPTDANGLYEYFLESASSQLDDIASGRFGAMMDVELVNDGPVTILLDSGKEF